MIQGHRKDSRDAHRKVVSKQGRSKPKVTDRPTATREPFPSREGSLTPGTDSCVSALLGPPAPDCEEKLVLKESLPYIIVFLLFDLGCTHRLCSP